MRYIAGLAIAFCIGALGNPAADAQTPEEVFKAAYAAAQGANKKAGELRNQWTTTAAALTAAQKMAAAGDFDAAAQLAKQAEAFANASIAQVERENTLWKESELH